VPKCRKLIKKKIIIFNLFYLCFCFGPQVCIGNSSFGVCGVVPWHGGVRNIILLRTQTHTHTHTHTSYFFNTSLTTFLFTPLIIHTQQRHEPRKTYFVEFCSSIPTCVVISSMNQEFLHGFSLLHQGKSN